MGGLRFRIKVDAPQEQVFDYVANMTRHPEWANPKASLAIEDVSGAAPMVGSKYRSRAVFFNKPVSADLTISAYERPSKFAYAVVHHQEGKKDQHYENTYTFLPQGGGTMVEKTLSGGGSPIVGLLFYPAIRADAMTSLRNLKAKLESGTS